MRIQLSLIFSALLWTATPACSHVDPEAEAADGDDQSSESYADTGTETQIDTNPDEDTEIEPQGPVTTEIARERLEDTLDALAGDSLMAFGQEDATAYGVGWWGDEDRSDVKSICGTHPAVYGWDLGDIGADANLDGVSFDHMRELIQNAYRLGGIITVSWHMDNLVTRGDSWDLTPAVAAIIPGGSHHEAYQAKLDLAADFMSRCRGDDDELIPIIFRPFHEHTGGWFWWGADHCTEGDYIELFQFTVEYMREEKGLDHLLFAFSPFAIGIGTEADYLTRYPGDDYVDVMGLDYYYGDTGEFDGADQLVRVAGIAVLAAEQRGKVAAITEFGIQDGLSNPAVKVDNWYTEDFLRPILRDPTARRAAYALTWRNADTSHFFVPYPGHVAEPDFRRVCDDPFVVMQEDLPL